MQTVSRNVLAAVVAAGCFLFVPGSSSAAEDAAVKPGLANEFFAFDNGTGRGKLTPKQQSDMLKELGYAGVGYTGAKGIPEMLEALDANGLKMFSIYVGARVGPGGPTYDPNLKEAIKQLKGRDTVIWLTIHGNAPDGDEQAVKVCREIGELAEASGLRVALYPHVGFFVARVEDGLRIVKKVDRKNVGASFNLCHFLKLDDEKQIEARLKEAMPHLFLVSINGADSGETNKMGWNQLIQTLDRGSFDVAAMMKTLRKLGYAGLVGLQCYAVKGNKRENLKRSMEAWKKMSPPAAPKPTPAPADAATLVVPRRDMLLHVAVELPAKLKLKPADAWQLVETSFVDTVIPAQLTTAMTADGTTGAKRLLVADIPPRDVKAETRRFRLEPAKERETPEKPAFAFADVTAKTVNLSEGDRPVWAYNHGDITDETVPEKDSRRTRGCYVHPVWGIGGEVITDDFPKDHYHHHGIFWAWPHVTVDGKHYSHWVYRDIQSRFVKWLARETGPVTATLAVENGWFVGDKKMIIERVWLRSYKTADDNRSMDVTLVIVPTDKPVTLAGAGGKSYGGLNVRFAPGSRDQTTITVPSGPTKGDLPNTPLQWADFTSKFKNSQVRSGAAVMVHPGHPDFPPTWLTRHYGPLCVGWPGVKPKTLEPGKPVRLSYRIWTHKAEADHAALKRAYQGYTDAAKATWE